MCKSIDTSATFFAKKGEYVTRAIAGEAIVVPVRGQVGELNFIYNLNDEASFIWTRIDGRTSVRQIVDALIGEFDVSREEAERDTIQFADLLKKAGLIEPSDPQF